MKKYQALMIPLGVVLLSFAGGLQAKKILLWNTLDSEQAVLNSEIGPNGTIVGTAFAFEAGQFGNGYIRKDLGDNWVEFPQSIPEQLHGEGTVEMWIVPKVPHPVPFEYGAFGLLNGGGYGPYNGFRLTWGMELLDWVFRLVSAPSFLRPLRHWNLSSLSQRRASLFMLR